VELVAGHFGVAILTQPTARGFHADDVVVKPLSDPPFCFETCVIMRTDNEPRLVNEYVRMFLRKYSPQRLPTKQVKLSPTARVLDWKTPIPAIAPLNSRARIATSRERNCLCMAAAQV